MKQLKKLLSLALVMCMLLTMLPMHVNAETPAIADFQNFVKNLTVLEEYAAAYAAENPGKDPAALTMQYIRTGAEGYNTSFWNGVAGIEDVKFAAYVQNVSGLKDLGNIQTPNGDKVDMGHMFAIMDIAYHGNGSDSYADAAGWAGDLVELMVLADSENITGSLDEKVQKIYNDLLLADKAGADFTQAELFADLDGYALVNQLLDTDYEAGTLANLIKDYYTSSQTTEQRAEIFLADRMNGVTDRAEIRGAAFADYTGNSLVATLENGKVFTSSDLGELRMACCYAFADYLCKLAGDYVDLVDNVYYTVTSSEKTTLTDGITLEYKTAMSSDNKQMVYYLATADVSNPYVNVYMNYKDNDPSKGWGMQTVRDQVHAAEVRHSDPNAAAYIPNYDVIVGVNGAGYNMSTGEPAGLLMMEGIEYQKPDNQDHDGYGFFGILKDGSAIIGSTEEYYELKEKGLIMEGIDNFGATLVKNGKIAINYTETHTQARHTRTAVGITKTGKVVMMVLEGRQEPRSCGGSYQEIAQIMLDAGCVDAINLDGGGSSTILAQKPGETDISLINSPSDGFERSVSASMMIVSTLPSNNEFDHAVVNSDVNYLTVGATANVTASGVSVTGKPADLPEGASWKVTDTGVATVSADGVVTGVANGKVDVQLVLDGKTLGSKTLNVVVPTSVYFTQETMNAVYGKAVDLPVAAMYQGKEVAITAKDVSFTLSNTAAGKINGFTFTGTESSNIRNVKITANAVNNTGAASGSIYINLYKSTETTFDFKDIDGGDYEMAWLRTVNNATSSDRTVFNIEDLTKPMVTDFAFAVDLNQIPVSQNARASQTTNAWTLLTTQAQTVTDQTQIQFDVQFDSNVQVDYSKIAVSNPCFTVKQADLSADNKLTITLAWKPQTQAIDPESVNSVCILSGISLTPKSDAQWDSSDRLSVKVSGNVTFKVALEGGTSFTAMQKSIYDEYALIKTLKTGWVYESNGYAYYDNGVKYTGVQKVGQFYYDFGDDGINVGQTKFTGIFALDGVNHYAKNGTLTGGWVTEGDDRYLFDENGKGINGKYVEDEVELNFDNGRLVSGYTGFLKKQDGKTYHYNNGEKSLGWVTIGDDLYHFNVETGVMTTGTHVIPDPEAAAKGAYYDFADDGKTLRSYFNGYGYYYWAGQPMRDAWVKAGNDPDPDAWYHTNGNGHFVTTPNANETFALTLNGTTYKAVKIAYDGVEYTFDNATGKLLLGSMVLKNSKWYYYWAGEPVNDGWFQFDGKTYYAYSDGHLATGSVIIDGNPHMFTPQGVMIEDGIQIQFTMSKDNSTMNVKVVNADTTLTRLAIWAVNAGQEATLKWIDLVKSGNNWVAEIPMCPFGLTETDTFELHVYGLVNGTETVVVNTTADQVAPGEHLYDSKYDYKCNACGKERTVDMTRPMVDMFRMYNPNTGEHFYTGSDVERDNLIGYGWQYEGVGFTFPLTTGKPVHRLFEPISGEHLYTMDEDEKDTLMAAGWNYEGIAFNSGFENEVPQYRLHNPNTNVGAYHFTASAEERDTLLAAGWEYQGIGWYSLGA